MKSWKKTLTVGALALVVATAAMTATGAASGLSDPTAASLPRLQRLGSQMGLGAAQKQQWQAAMDRVAEARDLMRAQNQATRVSAETELKKTDADLPALMAQIDENRLRGTQARLAARQELLAFYASASPAQQAQMREFMLDKLNLLSRFSAMRRFGAADS